MAELKSLGVWFERRAENILALLLGSMFAAFIVPTTFALSLATAVLVARTTVAQTFFRSVFFLPTACSYVVAALIWQVSR